MRPKILLPLDGSEISRKIVEYMGEILRGSDEGEITLYHVISIPPMLLEHGGSENPKKERQLGEMLREERRKWLEKNRKRIEKEIFAPAKRILREKGVREGAVTILTKLDAYPHPDVAWDIVTEIRANGYCAVVLGRKKTALREFLSGSVASKVDHHIANCAVWIIDNNSHSGVSSFTRKHKRYCGACQRKTSCPIVQSYQEFPDGPLPRWERRKDSWVFPLPPPQKRVAIG